MLRNTQKTHASLLRRAFRHLRADVRSRKYSHSNHRAPAVESLESRQMLSAINAFSDEFDDPSTLTDWQRINETEGWNADQLAEWNIGTTRPNQMTLIP